MKKLASAGTVHVILTEAFDELPDPRVERTRAHRLQDIIVTAICAVICGADGWVGVAAWGKAKESWLREFLDLPNGIPSHDTFGRVFAALDPVAFQRCFSTWAQNVAELLAGDIVAIDGKTLRRSFDKASEKAAIHMVTAWARRTGMVLGQVKTEEKSNEITAVPKLLELLLLKGCIVTMDAMHCQKETAALLVQKEADYVLSLKANQSAMLKEVASHFTESEKNAWKDGPFFRTQTINKGHGRLETRSYVACSNLSGLQGASPWVGLQSIVRVNRTREFPGATQSDSECVYFLTSLPANNVKKIAAAIRGHWSIENALHWCLDVAFDEDRCRIRSDHAPENMAVLRHAAITLLKKEKSQKLGVANKRLMAATSDGYLIKVLAG